MNIDFDFSTVMYVLFALFFVLPLIRRWLKARTNPESGKLKLLYPSTECRRRPARKKATPQKTPVVVADGGHVHTELLETPANVKKPVVKITMAPDMMVSQLPELRRLFDEVIANKAEIGEVILLADSPGGSALHYGALYEQVKRLTDAGLKVTALIDLVAASGGYLMILPCTKVFASPQSILGSIGVYASTLNYRRLLENYGIDPYWFVSGDVKVGVAGTNEVTQDAIDHQTKKVKETHDWFRGLVSKHRNVDIDQVSNGDIWRGDEALGLGLIDGLCLRDDYLMKVNETADIITLSVRKSTTMGERLFGRAAKIFADSIVDRIDTAVDRRLQQDGTVNVQAHWRENG